jgi:hypothetical protein
MSALLNLPRRTKIVIAGFVAAVAIMLGTSGIFTAGGVVNNDDGFVGGQITTNVTGAVISNLFYDLTGNTVSTINIQFRSSEPGDAAVNGKNVALWFTTTLGATVNYVCPDVTTFESLCVAGTDGTIMSTNVASVTVRVTEGT